MAENKQKPAEGQKAPTLSKTVAFLNYGDTSPSPAFPENPWITDAVDKLGGFYTSSQEHKNFRNLVGDCRFYYRRDAMASSVVNKMIEIAFNGIRISQGNLSDNQFKLFEYIKEDVEDFVEACALEYLMSGLLIPEIEFAPLTKRALSELGIKRYTSLKAPKSMWLWDPNTIIIRRPPIGSEESIFVEIDDKLVAFIKNKGIYPNGEEDKELYNEIVKLYPAFIQAIRKGETRFKLDTPDIIKRRVMIDSPYPIPFLSPALESLKHKRNLRRMDYSLASRAIGAIQHFKVGNDEFPVIEGDDDVITDIKNQMFYRNTAGTYIERIFQLFTNHTVEIDWVIPPLDVLVDAQKYEEINLDILQAMGFPKILITGEVQRTGTTDADIAILSPLKTMEFIRRKLIRVVRRIFFETSEQNGFADVPEVDFNPINLVGFKDYIAGLKILYESGNLSRYEYADFFGKNFEISMKQLVEDNKLIEDLDLTEFAPLPNSRVPENTPNNEKSKQKK